MGGKGRCELEREEGREEGVKVRVVNEEKERGRNGRERENLGNV